MSRICAHRSVPRRAAGLAVALGITFLGSSALAGTISLELTASPEVRGDGSLVVSLRVRNVGDETASSVSPTLRFRSETVTGDAAPQLPPQQTLETRFTVEDAGLGAGRWPYAVAVAYADANQYPFHALHAGTVVGNVVNASPAADVVPVLLALEARVDCLSAAGAREVPLAAFLLGPGETARRPDELVTAVRFAPLGDRSATAFLKAGRRRAMEISVACVAVRLTLEAGGDRCAQARIALGAVAPTTVRAVEAERLLEGQPLTPERLRAAGRAAAAECRPITDVRASADYRRLLVATLVPRALARCLDRIGEGAL